MKRSVSLRISVPMYKHLHNLSREAGVSLSSFIEQRLAKVEDQLQIQSLLEQFDRLSEELGRFKSVAPSPIVVEFLKEISIRLDSRIPSIVRARLTQQGDERE